MTDTRVTVDVSTEALLQRARQQQAQGRQAAIQRQEERKGVDRQKRQARKAGRNQPPGQDRLKGRSKLRGMTPRHEVAAGYVEKYSLAKGYIQWVLDKGDLDSDDPVTDRYKLHSGDQQSSVFFEIKREVSVLGLYNSYVFPVGGNSLIFVGVSYVLSGGIPDWTVDCFHISRSNVRRISSPQNIIDSLLSFDPSVHIGFIDDPQEAIPYWPSGNPALFESTWRYGDVGSLQSANGIEQTKPPKYLTLATKRVARSMTGRLFLTPERTGDGIAAPWLNGSPRLASEEIYVFDYGEGIINFDPSEWPEFGSYLLAAWDWGKPDLCRRLLLQLGFRSEDLRP